MYGLNTSEIDVISKIYDGDIRNLPALILNYRKERSIKKDIGGFASVFSYKRRGISYYNDYTPILKAGYEYQYLVKIPSSFSFYSAFFKKRREKKVAKILTKMICNYLSSLSDGERFEALTERKDKVSIPRDYVVHELYDEVDYDYIVDKVFLLEGSDSILLEVRHQVKTYPLLSRIS